MAKSKGSKKKAASARKSAAKPAKAVRAATLHADSPIE